MSVIRADPAMATEVGLAAIGLDLPDTSYAMASIAVAVPTAQNVLQAMLRRKKDRDAGNLEGDISSDSVDSIFRVIYDVRNNTATDVLDAELADLMDEPDWDTINRRLNDAVRIWSRERATGAGNPPDRDTMVQVLLSLIRNVREAQYRGLFVDYYRQIFSVDRRDRSTVNDVFTLLKFDHTGQVGREEQDVSNQPTKPQYLDFRGKSPSDIETGLRKLPNVVILGEPGSGKSTLLRYLALSCAQSEAPDPLLPIFLPLNTLANGEDMLIADSALTFAEDTLQVAMPNGFFDDALRSGRCLVCLDALDEVPSEQRHGIVRKVEQLTLRYPDSHFIITSRRAGYDEGPLDEQKFNRYVIHPMDDDNITAFINWLCGNDLERAQNLLDVLDTNRDLVPLVSSPLLLAILDLVYREDDRRGFPLKTTGLYARAVEELIKDVEFNVDADTRRKRFYAEREKILAAVAHHMHSAGRETIGKNHLERFVAAFLRRDDHIHDMTPSEAQRQAKAFVDLAERRTGLLVGEHVGRTTQFRFLHSTFREYLSARYIYLNHFSEGPDAFWAEIKDHIKDYHWRKVIVFLLCSFDEDDEEYATYLTENIIGTSSRDNVEANVHRRLHIAADALANQATMSHGLQQDIILKLAQRFDAEPNPMGFEDFRALCAIQHLPALVIPHLTSIANNPSANVGARLHAAITMGRLGQMDPAIAALKTIVAGHEVDGWELLDATEALARLGRRDAAITALNTIAASAEYDGWGDRTSAAVEGLVRLGASDVAIATLATIAINPMADNSARALAAGNLGRLGERDTAMTTLYSLVSDSTVRGWARVHTATELEHQGAKDLAKEILASIVYDPEMGTSERAFAARRLHHLDDEEMKDVYQDVLASIVADPEVSAGERDFAVRCLFTLGDKTIAVTILQTIAYDLSLPESIRHTARTALGIGLPSVRFL